MSSFSGESTSFGFGYIMMEIGGRVELRPRRESIPYSKSEGEVDRTFKASRRPL